MNMITMLFLIFLRKDSAGL